jgi:hypothetical protein
MTHAVAGAASTGLQVDWTRLPFENIDRLLLVEMRIANSTEGIVPQLYDLARGRGPLSQEIAGAILERPRAKVGFLTGVYFPPHFPVGEIDGPIGGLVLARALGELGYATTLVMEGEVISATQKLVPIARAGNARFVDGNELTDAVGVSALVKDLDVLIASERIGVNSRGVRHSINGTLLQPSPAFPWPDALVETMNQSGKLTIGLGDGGNEIGFGKIYESGREIVPYGRRCQCPCGDGMFTRTATQLLWPVNVSNLGVYGLIAAIGLSLRRPDLLHDEDTERALLREAIGAGFRDGGTGLPEEAQDGIPAIGAIGLVMMLRALVSNAVRDFKRPF